MKIKLSEVRELIGEIIKEEMDAYQPAPEDEKDTEEEKPPHPALVEKQTNEVANIPKAEFLEIMRAFSEMYANTENRQDEPFVSYVRKTCRTALDNAKKVMNKYKD